MITAEVLPDGRNGDQPVFAIVSDTELPEGTGWAGHQREADELHTGRWAYPFTSYLDARSALTRMEREGLVNV